MVIRVEPSQLNVGIVRALVTRKGLPPTRVGRMRRFDEACVRKWFDGRWNRTAKEPWIGA